MMVEKEVWKTSRFGVEHYYELESGLKDYEVTDAYKGMPILFRLKHNMLKPVYLVQNLAARR